MSRALRRIKGDPQVALDGFTKLRTDYLPRQAYRGARDDQIGLTRMSSFLISRYIDAARVTADGHLDIDGPQRGEVDLLKQLTRVYTIESPSLGSLQQGQRRVVRDLYTTFTRWVEFTDGRDKGRGQLPVQLWDILTDTRSDPGARDAYATEDALRARAIVDYITALTEAQALDLHERLHGSSSGSGLSTWLTVG
jgi:dGTP triphosphohydrolase